jgi:hypothetical protein
MIYPLPIGKAAATTSRFQKFRESPISVPTIEKKEIKIGKRRSCTICFQKSFSN